MDVSSTAKDPPSLCDSYQKWIDSFRRLILALGEDGCRVIHLEQVHLPDILDEYGRAKIWGNQSRTDLPARARGSLDDTLRHDEELKEIVRDIFGRLEHVLEEAISIAERKYDPEDGEDYDSVSSVTDDSASELDSDDDTADEERRRRSKPKIRFLVDMIMSEIQSLFQVSSILRRPKVADKYIRSVNSKLDATGDPDSLPLSVGFHAADENHVIEKVMQWRGVTKIEKSVDLEKEESAGVGEEARREHVEDIMWFCERLARANTRRREQLRYWNAHPYDSKKDRPKAAEVPSQPLEQSPVKLVEEVQEVRSQASTLKQPESSLPTIGPKSTFSKQSFSTTAVSLVHETKTNVRPKTVYAPTAVGKGRTNSVPDLPRPKDGSGTFLCPYCGTSLEYDEMQNRQTWQRHVFRDLRPYVCSFEDCQNAGKLYVSRHDWIYHELQVHRREYFCKECDKRFPTREEASEHFRDHYGEKISELRFSIILDLSERQVDPSLGGEESCLICGEELSLLAMQSHLGSHMESIALFVLPNAEEDNDTEASKASVEVAKLGSGANVSKGESEASSLGFSEVGDRQQDPTDFAKVLKDENVSYQEKFESWGAESEDNEDLQDPRTPGPLSAPRSKKVEDSQDFGLGPGPDNDYTVHSAGNPYNTGVERSTGQSIPGESSRQGDATPPAVCGCTIYETQYICGDTVTKIVPCGLCDNTQPRTQPRLGRPISSPLSCKKIDCRNPNARSSEYRQPVSYAAWMALAGGDDNRTNIWGYLFPFDTKNPDCLVLKTTSLARNKTSSREPRSPVTNRRLQYHLIGRGSDCDFILSDDRISNHQFSISQYEVEGSFEVVIAELSSSGTYVNDALIRDPPLRTLKNGDRIRLPDDSQFIFAVPEPPRKLADFYLDSATPLFSRKLHDTPGDLVMAYEREPAKSMRLEGFFRFCSRGQDSNRHHAVKSFVKQSLATRKYSRRFAMQEISALMRINHDNILCLWDTLEDSSDIHLVFDGDPKTTLGDPDFRNGRRFIARRRRYFHQVFTAVKYLHDQHIIHCDIRPQNIMVMDDGQSVKLANFECSNIVGSGVRPIPRMINLYTAPEMMTDTLVSSVHLAYPQAQDIWSLGVVILDTLSDISFLIGMPTKDIPSSLQRRVRTFYDNRVDERREALLGFDGIHLLKEMVVLRPENRLTIDDCLSHHWFSPLPEPVLA